MLLVSPEIEEPTGSLAILTDAFIRKLKPPERGQRTYTDGPGGVPGFGLRISQAGTCAWTLVYGRKRTRLQIGRYPILSLSQARSKAKTILAEIQLGAYKKARGLTFEEAFETYRSTRLQSLREGSRREIERLIGRALPRFGRSELGKIATPELAAFLDTLAKTPSEANHCFNSLRTFMTWCVRRGYIENSPLGRLQKPHSVVSRDRVFSLAELRSVLSTAFLEGSYNRVIAILLCSGQRWGQIVALRESHIDRQNRTLSWSAHEMKTGVAFTLPYSSLTASLIEPPFIPFTKATRYHARFMEQCGVYGWVRHDCRRVYRSVHAQIGTRPDLAERMLAHRVAGPVQQIYDRYRYEPEIRQAQESYEKFLASLIDGS
jgi:integrase